MREWGFDCSDQHIKDFFEWMDKDGDNKISFEDLRDSVGKEMTTSFDESPFRGESKKGKPIVCKYERCFENNSFNASSMYCQLHQKMLKD